MTTAQQFIAQVRPEEAGSAGDKTGGHGDLAYGLCLRRGGFAALAAGLAAACCGLLNPVAADAWTPAGAIVGGTSPQPLAVAADTSGNGVAVAAGAAADSPLLLVQRDAVAGLDGVAFAWNAPTPLPGGVPTFTSSTALAEGAGAAAGGAGAAALVVRFRVDGADTFSAIVRDSGERFGPAATIVPGNFDRLSDPIVATSAAGTTVVGFEATRASGRRAAVVARLSGNEFGTPRVISLPGVTHVTTAVGPGESGLVAWTRAARAEVSTLDERGRARRYRVLGHAAPAGEIAAAASQRSAIVAWEGPGGTVRVSRRDTGGASAFGKPVTARGRGPEISAMAAAVDPTGVAYVVWREGTGASTRILVARASAGRRFRVDQVAAGSGLGRPAAIARPIGGTLVGWAAKVGWQARKVPTSGGLPIQSTVSAPGTSTAVPLARPFLGAGPGARTDVTWIQPSDGQPGYDVMQSSDTER